MDPAELISSWESSSSWRALRSSSTPSSSSWWPPSRPPWWRHDPVAFLDTLGESFVSNRSMCIFIMTFVITGTLERSGLRQAAAALIRKLKNASAGMIVSAYGVVRVLFAAFNVNFGGVAGFIRPVVMPWSRPRRARRQQD